MACVAITAFCVLAGISAAQTVIIGGDNPDEWPLVQIPPDQLGTTSTIVVNGVTTVTTPLLSAWQGDVLTSAHMIFVLAALANDPVSIRVLQQRGADINVREREVGNTPLHSVVEAGKPDAAELLLKAGANPNLLNGRGTSPLYDAVALGHYEAIAKLLKHGADPNLPEARLEMYPLQTAATDGDTTATLLLLQAGARTEVTDANGVTPLLLAVNSRKTDAVRVLLEWGADPLAQTRSGNTAQKLAKQGGYVEIEKLLLHPPALLHRNDTPAPASNGAQAMPRPQIP